MVRLPGFEPGSSAWQADVLDQTRLQPQLLIVLREILLRFLFSFSKWCIKALTFSFKRISKFFNLF